MSTAAAPLETPLPRSQPIFSWRATLGIVSLLLAFGPIVYRYLRGVIQLPHYEFVLLLPIGAAILAVPRWGRLGNLSPGRAVPFFWLLGSGIALLLASTVLDSPWFGAIAALFAAAAAIYAVGGRRLLLVLLPAWCLLWLGIRLPLTADEHLSQSLQQIAASRASAVLNYLGEDHILDGNVVETPRQRYMVEEACSGVQSLFAITACTVFFAFWMREPPGRVILLLLVAWWWVWLANVGRVIAVTVLNSRWDLPVADGMGHTILGVVLFCMTLGLIVSSEHLILFFLPRGIFTNKDKIGRVAAKPTVDHGPTRLPSLSQTWLSSSALVVACMGLTMLQWLPQMNVSKPTATPVTLDGLQAGMVPTEIQGWRLRDDGYSFVQRRADSQWGAKSQTWRYVKGPKELVISVDYPFLGWHELTICYRADGWNMESRKVVDVQRDQQSADVIGENEKCVETVLQKPQDGAYGFLMFTSFNDRQEALPVAQQLSLYQRLLDRVNSFWDRLRTMGAVGSGKDDQVQSFQMQVFLQLPATPTELDREEARAVFSEIRTRLGRHLKQITSEAQ